ncbi:MAG: hypothetical protein JO040_02205, partial [Gemmatimonadetes bacterium]|nr:hypothetical protein [Gemmatimonadota bacterium]
MSGPRPDDLPGSVLLFADFAARQLARRLDAGSPPGEAERGWRERVAGVLRRAEAGGPEAAAELLAAEPVLLSVFFQNVDLLYEHAYP